MFRTDESLDLYKLQMFIFTVGIAVYVVWRVIKDHAFPEIQPSMLLLLGISNGVYVASKIGETPLQAAGRLDQEKSYIEKLRDSQQAKVDRLTLEVAAATASQAELDAAKAELAALDAQIQKKSEEIKASIDALQQ